MVISHWLVLNNWSLTMDGVTTQLSAAAGPEALYREWSCNYPKFFKMDILCKWAWVATERLLSGDAAYAHIEKSKAGIVLSTSHGCLDVDKRFADSINMPSPALFVYTLPNIMLGEICIRHGFKGEQLCMVSEQFDADEIHFAASNLIKSKGMDACLCGWVDVSGDKHTIFLYWITKSGSGSVFTPDKLRELSQLPVH